jgi:hypothetical protein
MKVKVVERKKFMWDGIEYATEAEAKEAMLKYKSDGFEVIMEKEGDKFFVYTRRVAAQVVVEGSPPA